MVMISTMFKLHYDSFVHPIFRRKKMYVLNLKTLISDVPDHPQRLLESTKSENKLFLE